MGNITNSGATVAPTLKIEHAFGYAERIGLDGLSAYQIWLAQGNSGTEEDFLAYLRQPAESALETMDEAVEAAEGATAAALESASLADDAAAAAVSAASSATTAANSATTAAEAADAVRESMAADMATKAGKPLTSMADNLAAFTGTGDLADSGIAKSVVALRDDRGFVEMNQIPPEIAVMPTIAGVDTSEGNYYSSNPALTVLGVSRSVVMLFQTGDDVVTEQRLMQQSSWLIDVVKNGFVGSFYGNKIAAIPHMVYMTTTVYDAATGLFTSYVNSIEMGSFSPTTEIRRVFSLGANASNENRLQGIILSCRFFDYALSADEIAALWNDGLPEHYELPESGALREGCIYEYLPCGLLSDRWRPTVGEIELAVSGSPKIVSRNRVDAAAGREVIPLMGKPTGCRFAGDAAFVSDSVVWNRLSKTIALLFTTGDDVSTQQYLWQDSLSSDKGTAIYIAAGKLYAGQFNQTPAGSILIRPGATYFVVMAINASIVTWWVNGSRVGQCNLNAYDSKKIYLGGQSNRYFKGTIRSMRLFSYVFEASDVARFWNGGRPYDYMPERNATLLAEYLPAGLLLASGTWRNSAGGDTGPIILSGNSVAADYNDPSFPDPILDTGVPTSIPDFAGQRYVDSATGDLYIARNNVSASDWNRL